MNTTPLPHPTQPTFGMVCPLLQEILQALQTLRLEAKPHSIDLASLPLAPGEEESLMQLLGHGEVEAHLNALGSSRCWETRFPGVWVVEHRNEQQHRIAFHLEITHCPALLPTPREELSAAEADLSAMLLDRCEGGVLARTR